MRRTLALLLAGTIGAAACSSSNGGTNPDEISVGGTYQTAVTMVENDCPGQTIQQHPTVVNHAPGATTLSLTHAGSTYSGSLSADGSFTTSPLTQVVAGISYVVSIAGQFTETEIDALVLVEAGRQPPCSFTARWAGPKSGDRNEIP